MMNLRVKIIGIISIFSFLFINIVLAAPEVLPPSAPVIPASEERDLYILESYTRGNNSEYIYGVDEINFEVDKSTLLDSSTIGTVQSAVVSTAVNFSTGDVFSVFHEEGVYVLGTLDMNSGELIEVGNLSENIQSIAFDKNGNLYGLSSAEESSLYSIDEINAEITFIENYNYNHSGVALSYDIENELMYYLDGVDMYTIDLDNPSEPIIVYEDIGAFGDDLDDLVNIDGENFYIIENGYVVYNVNINTGVIFEVADIDTLDYYYYIGGIFFYPAQVGIGIESLEPANGSNTAGKNDDLEIQFTDDVVSGNGNIGIYKYDDESLIEELDVTSDRVVGWNTESLIIDFEQELSFDTKYFVLMEDYFVNDFEGFSDKDDWSFTTRQSGNEFGFEDGFDTENFVDKDGTTASWDDEDTSFSLESSSGIWTNADRSTLGKENIQNNMNERGYDPKITLNSDGNQMVVWEEDEEIMFTMWNGSNWVTMDDALGKESISITTSMCSGEDGEGEGGEGMGMIDGVFDFFGINSAFAADENCRRASQPQIFTDNDGNPVVAWIGIEDGDPSLVDVFVRRWNGDAWVAMGGNIDSDKLFDDKLPTWNYEFDMVLSSSGYPMVVSTYSLWGGEGQQILYSEWNGLNWSGKWGGAYDWLDFQDFARHPRIARTSDDVPMLIWVEESGEMPGIYFTQWNGDNWMNFEGDSNDEQIESIYTNVVPRIEINSSNFPVVAYAYNDEVSIVSVKQWIGDSWEGQYMTTQYNEIIRLNLDSEDSPIISWVNGQQDVHLSKLVGESWQKMDGTNGYDVVDATGKQVQYMDMELTSDNSPMLVWSELEWSSTHFKMWNGSAWTGGDGISTDSNSLSGDVETSNLDIVINENDEPSVVWGENWGDQDIHFSILPIEIISPAVVQSNKINGSIKDIIKATLTADEVLEGESRIEYYLSIDGGDTWIQVNRGEELIFDAKGDDLKWKAILYKGSVPVLNGVNVEYETQSITPPEPGMPVCGSNAKQYNADETAFTGNFCEIGIIDTTPSFPNENQTVKWNCTESSNTVECSALRSVTPSETPKQKQCKTENIKEVTKDSVTLRVEVDEEYADEKIKFKVEVENLYTGEKETIKLTDKPSDNGKATLLVDNLEEGTEYRFKVSYQEDDSYEYCPHSKTATTEKTTLGPVKEIVSPECGESNKIYKENEIEFIGDFCQTGEVLNTPIFPNQGKSSSWTCTNDNEEIICSASREEKEIVTPPVVQGGSDPEITETIVEQEPTKEQPKEKPYQAAAVIGLITGTLIALASTTIPLFTTIPMAATDIFIMPFLGLLARRKNEQNWGTVFEQTTKQPLPGVKLVLTDTEGFEIETTYSDQHGRFGFLTTNGTYLIHPEKAKYEEDLTHNHDSLYGDVYTGEALIIDENKVLTTNIAMNALNINWNEYADKKVKSYTGTFSAIKKWSFIILFYAGFIATAVITYLYPSTLNYIFLTLYMALFIYDNFIKQKRYGTVTKDDKNPVPFAVVSLHDKQTNQKTGFAVTDAIGRYYLLAENGDYNMKVKGQPISGDPFEKRGNINVRKGIVREDVKV